MTRLQRIGFALIGLAAVMAVTTVAYDGQSLMAFLVACMGVFLVAVG